MKLDQIKRREFIATQKRSGHGITIGFAGVADYRSFIGQEYISGVTQAANDYGINLINFAGSIRYSVSDDIDFIKHYMKKYRFMKTSAMDGLVVWGSSLTPFFNSDEIRRLHDDLKPMPMVDIGVPILNGIPMVTIRAADGIHLMMEHLVKVHGYTRIGFLGCAAGFQYAERLDTWREEMRRFDLKEDPAAVFIMDKMDARDVALCAEKLCSRFEIGGRKSLEALVTVSDIAATSMIDELENRGFSVPDDIAITGINNQPGSMRPGCPITTLDLSFYVRGYSAVELLLDNIRDPAGKYQSLKMEPKLVIRRSCGCFEDAIRNAALAEPIADIDATLVDVLPDMNPAERKALTSALLKEVELEQSAGSFLPLFRSLLVKVQEKGPLDVLLFQELISDLRRWVLSLHKKDDAARDRLENIFHQARVLLTVQNTYHDTFRHTDPLRFNALSRMTIGLSSVNTTAQILETVGSYLGELGIPGIMVALGDELQPDMGGVSVDYITPLGMNTDERFPYRLKAGHLVPASLFPRDRSWVMMMEIFFHAGMYIGYALIETGPVHVPLYDSIRTLLSHALYAVYVREGRSRLRENLLRTEPVAGILSKEIQIPGGISLPVSSANAANIIEYLVDRIDEMTDLERMAKDLSISKSTLVRRTRNATGYSVQSLHEMLKIERAKIMLQNGAYKLSDIAASLGYQNSCYFSAVFKKNMGMSPRDWRKSL